MRDHRLKILLVEDNPGDARLIRETLAEAAPGGAEVEWVGQLSAATKRLAAGGIDVVLLDLGLPDSQGLDTLVLATAAAPEVPFVVLTGLEDEATAMAASSKGAQDYIVKGDRKGEALVRALRYAIERKQTGEALLRSEGRFRSLTDTAPDAIISMGADRCIRVFNKAAERIFGYSAEEIVGQSLDRLIPPEYRDRHAVAIGRYLETGEARILGKVVELTALRKSSEAFPVALAVSATGSGGEVTFTGIIRDIQVLVNLITNAQHAMRETPPPRRLTLRTSHEPREHVVCLQITDTGPGIPPEVRTRIFDPFFTTKPPGQGTGLGLSLSRGIVEAHGGALAAESPSGQGATFRVRLPVIAAPVAEKEAGALEAAAPVRGETILVVDDEPEIAALLADLLAAGGQEVETAANGALALEKIGKRAYGAILSDIKMPELDGPGLYRELERRHPDLVRRVIFLTGDTLAPGTAEFLGRTGAPVLTKPFRVEEVIRVVQRVLQMGTREPFPEYGRPGV